MNKLFLAALVLLALANLGRSGPRLRTIDGDTLAHGEQRLRLACVDAPETNQPYGPQATAYLDTLAINRYTIVDIDRYGRQVVIAYTNDTPVQALLLEQGLAWFTPSFRRSCPDYADFFQQLELEARQQRRGLWNDPNPIPPWTFRRPSGY